MKKNLIHSLMLLVAALFIGNLSAQAENLTTAAEEPKVGDFFYQDGTWSAEYKGTAANPCIGLVFAIGSGVGDKASNYPGTGMTAIRGYVVAVNDAAGEKGSRFCNLDAMQIEGVQTGGKRYSGFADTKAISKFSDYSEENYPAAALCLKYNETVKAPAGTSGWYLPASPQVEAIAGSYYNHAEATPGILFQQMDVLRKNSAGTPMGRSNYWTSTPSKDKSPCRVSFNPKPESTVYGTTKGTNITNTAFTRAILTF